MARRLVLHIFVIFCVLHHGFGGVTVEQMKQSIGMVRNVCQPKHKVSDEAIENLANGVFPEDKSVKCYVHCIMDMTALIKKSKVNYDSAMKQFDTLLPDEFKDVYKAALNTCKDSTGGVKDPCEAAYNFMKCFQANNPKFVS